MNMARRKEFIIVASIIFSVIIVSLILYSFFLGDRYSPNLIPIQVLKNNNISLNTTVTKKCIYMAVIGFESLREDGKSEHLRNAFGYKDFKENFPINLSMSILGKNNGFISEEIINDGIVSGTVFGGEYIWFIVGYYQLHPDDYSIKINMRDIRYDLPDLEAYFLIKPFYNAKCS